MNVFTVTSLFTWRRREEAMINNPVRGRFNAWLLAALDGYMHGKYAAIKTRLLAGAPPVIVEIGPGSGANLRYLPRGTRLIAVEPNRQMHSLLRRRAKKLGIDLDLRGLTGEAMDLPSASADLVFSSLVLCTVEDPHQVVAASPVSSMSRPPPDRC
jgi:ubiquinone/menaquinone biosynthesis C-methylase UbiE